MTEPDFVKMMRIDPADPAVLAKLPEVQAMIAAAWVNAEIAVCSVIPHDEDAAVMQIAQVDAIRALTPADAKAALDRMLREERNKALREVFYLKKDDDAILAMIQETSR